MQIKLRESLASGEIAAVQSTLVADNTPLNSRVYTVRSGDTLSSIASRLGVSTKDLQQWNKLRGSKLKPGQSLTIGAGSSAQRLANNSDSITYRVRKGDSLSSIAKRHGVNIKDVMRWNSDTANATRRQADVVCEKQQHARFLTNQIIKKHRFPRAFFIYAALCASTMMISLVKEPSFCKAKYVLTSVDALCW
ncbi:LysM peptidoglycan-binding domain-containing protein [Escherichia coli]